MTKPPSRRIGSVIPSLFERLGMSAATPNDSFTINYTNNIFTVTLRRAETSSVETLRTHRNGKGFSQVTSFNPDEMSKNDRNDIVLTLRKDRIPQQQIADLLGLSQSTVSNICRKKNN